MKTKIITGKTLEQYNKKYGNKNLKKVSKIDADKDSKLLEGHTWWLIEDVYYEVPTNKKFIAWWNNLGKGARIAICSLAGVGVTSAVVFPTLAATVWNKKEDKQEEDIKFNKTCTLIWSGIGCFENELNPGREHYVQLKPKLGDNLLLIVDFSIAGRTDYNNMHDFSADADDPQEHPAFEKIEFVVNGKKLNSNQYECKASEGVTAGYNQADIKDQTVLNSFNAQTIIKIRLINCQCIAPSGEDDAFHFGIGKY